MWECWWVVPVLVHCNSVRTIESAVLRKKRDTTYMCVCMNRFLFVSTKGPREQLRYHENRIKKGVLLLL